MFEFKVASAGGIFDGADYRALDDEIESKLHPTPIGATCEAPCPTCLKPCGICVSYHEMIGVAIDIDPSYVAAADSEHILWEQREESGEWYVVCSCPRCAARVKLIVPKKEAADAVIMAKRHGWLKKSKS